jgi:hypothetical protein
MGEGPSPAEVGKEIERHSTRGSGQEDDRRDRLVTIAGAVLLSIVTLLAAWSGYAAAKWSTESRVALAEATTLRVKANRADSEAATLRNFDSSTFEAWFAAYIAGNRIGMQIAERRFRPEFRVAFDAWRATNPETNANAAPGPTFMPEYMQPGLATRRALDEHADDAFDEGEESGATGDKYVRLTVLLASILFLVGISTQFPMKGVRYGLIALATVLLVLSLVQIATLPKPRL